MYQEHHPLDILWYKNSVAPLRNKKLSVQQLLYITVNVMWIKTAASEDHSKAPVCCFPTAAKVMGVIVLLC